MKKGQRALTDRERDERDLEALDARSRRVKVWQISAALGVSETHINSVCRKVREEADADCDCLKPENKDGGMPAGWWRS